MRRAARSTGLEGAPDVMLLTMSALMVAVVWLVAHVHEATLPPVELPDAAAARLGAGPAATLNLTLRPGPGGAVEVYLEDRRLERGIDEVEDALAGSGAAGVTLRADSGTRWEDGLRVMDAAARLGLQIHVAAEP